MFGAGATGEDELLLESLASAVSSNGGIARSDSGSLRERFERVLREIDFADDLAVRRLEVVEDVVDALTDDLLSGLVELGFDSKILGPLFQGAIFGGTVTVVVDDSVAEDAVEPCDRRLVATEG